MNQKGFVNPIIVGLALVVVFGGAWHFPPAYAQGINTNEQGGPAPGYIDTKKDSNPKIDNTLYYLTKTDDYQKFAKANGLNVVGNKVQVYLNLYDNTFVLPADFGTEEIRLKDYNLIQAFVQIDKLVTLAEDSRIKHISVPGYGVTNRPTPLFSSNFGFRARGEIVKTLQQKLQSLGYFPKEIQPTSYFGSVTKKAVTDFQRAKKLPTTGFVGPLTRNALGQ